MTKKEALEFLGLEELPEVTESTDRICVALVSRRFGENDYCIVNEKNDILCDKGYKECIKKILEYYPKIEESEAKDELLNQIEALGFNSIDYNDKLEDELKDVVIELENIVKSRKELVSLKIPEDEFSELDLEGLNKLLARERKPQNHNERLKFIKNHEIKVEGGASKKKGDEIEKIVDDWWNENR